MGHIENLKLTEITRAFEQGTPEARLRRKMVSAIDLQMRAVQAMIDGETFVIRRPKWITDPESGERVTKELPVRFRPWYWQDAGGKFMLNVSYGNRPLEIKPKMSTIEVGKIEGLVPALQTLRDGVLAGELDKLLLRASGDRRFGKSKIRVKAG